MNITVDSRGFLMMVNDLSRMSGKDYETVLKAEAARVIEKAIAYTPKANVKFKGSAKDEAERRNTTFPDDKWPRIAITKSKDLVWLGETDDALVDPQHPRIADGRPVWHRMNDGKRRWNSRRWNAYRTLDAQRKRNIQLDARLVAADRKAKKAAAGLSKRSWWQIGKDLGLPMRDVPQYVTGAKPSNGMEYKNGHGTRHLTSGGLFLRLENDYPALISGRVIKKSKSGKTRSMNGHAILQRAINTRLSAFKYEIKKGVFNDIKMRAARHPGVFVKP